MNLIKLLYFLNLDLVFCYGHPMMLMAESSFIRLAHGQSNVALSFFLGNKITRCTTISSKILVSPLLDAVKLKKIRNVFNAV
jgi:hypothetical protein